MNRGQARGRIASRSPAHEHGGKQMSMEPHARVRHASSPSPPFGMEEREKKRAVPVRGAPYSSVCLRAHALGSGSLPKTRPGRRASSPSLPAEGGEGWGGEARFVGQRFRLAIRVPPLPCPLLHSEWRRGRRSDVFVGWASGRAQHTARSFHFRSSGWGATKPPCLRSLPSDFLVPARWPRHWPKALSGRGSSPQNR